MDELIRIQQELQETEERFRAVFESANDAMSLSDENGTVIAANPAYSELYGYSLDEIVGQNFAIIFPEERRASANDVYRQVFAGQREELFYESTIQRKDGTMREVESRVGFVTRNGVHTAMLSVIRDITDRKQAEAALRKYMNDLQRSNSELEHYAYVASHDLQEPLRMVVSYLQLLQQRYASQLDQNAHEFIGFALDGATRMKAMIGDVLTYSRLNTDGSDFAPFNSENALRLALSHLELKIAEADATVLHDPLPTVIGSERQFVQLFQNLISNAIKFRSVAPPEVSVTACRDAGEWRFSVADNGIGIPQEHLERIFNMFQRLHASTRYPGTGIGLAICRKVVEHHGGRLWAESRVGRGTTFHFTIPDRVL